MGEVIEKPNEGDAGLTEMVEMWMRGGIDRKALC